MTQPRSAQHAGFLTAAVQNASRGALCLSVVAVALIGTDAAVAVSRTSGSSHPASSSAGVGGPSADAQPGIAFTPPAVAPTTSAQASHAAEGSTAAALLAKAISDALAQHTVHATTRAVYAGLGTAMYDNRAALSGGEQRLTIYGGHIAIRVIGATTYYNADRLGLIRFLLFSQQDAAAYNQRWVRLTRGEKGYRVLTAGVTLSSLLNEDRMGDTLKLLPTRHINGVKVIGIRGPAGGGTAPKHAVATMWVTLGDHPLPVKYTQKSRRLLITQTFSEWGTPVRLKTPRHAVGETAGKT